MKQKVHSSHMGIESTIRRARECIFWPGMSLDIKQLTEACETCCKFEAKHTEGISDASWYATPTLGKVGTNLFELNNKDYLVTVDYYSNFFEIDKLEDTKASAVIQKLKSHFTRYSTLDQVVSDSGPQFSSDNFAQFAREWEFDHHPSSPAGNSKANGKAESAVKTTKWLMQKVTDAQTDPYLALLEYCNTPTQGIV